VQWLLRQLGDASPVRLALRLGPALRPVEGAEAFQHVVGLAAAASFDRGAEVVLVLACDDFDAPRAVADALAALRGPLASQLGTPGLGHALRTAQIERRAGDVRIRATLDGSDLDALLGSLEQALRPATTESPPATSRDH
jgi:hypothetical protein